MYFSLEIVMLLKPQSTSALTEAEKVSLESHLYRVSTRLFSQIASRHLSSPELTNATIFEIGSIIDVYSS